MPLPHDIAIERHLVGTATDFARMLPSWLGTLLHRDQPSFYRKELNYEVAKYLSTRDLDTTDLGRILREAAARYARVRAA